MRLHHLEIVTTDADAALSKAVAEGGEVAHPPLEISGRGTFSI